MGELLEKAYKWLYTKFSDKPFTELIRIDQKKAPLVYMLLFLLGGIIVTKYAKENWWKVVITLLVGIVIGHLF